MQTHILCPNCGYRNYIPLKAIMNGDQLTLTLLPQTSRVHAGGMHNVQEAYNKFRTMLGQIFDHKDFLVQHVDVKNLEGNDGKVVEISTKTSIMPKVSVKRATGEYLDECPDCHQKTGKDTQLRSCRPMGYFGMLISLEAAAEYAARSQVFPQEEFTLSVTKTGDTYRIRPVLTNPVEDVTHTSGTALEQADGEVVEDVDLPPNATPQQVARARADAKRNRNPVPA